MLRATAFFFMVSAPGLEADEGGRGECRGSGDPWKPGASSGRAGGYASSSTSSSPVRIPTSPPTRRTASSVPAT